MSDELTTKLAEALRCYVTGDEFNERTENQLYNQAREALRLHAEVERLSAPLAATPAPEPLTDERIWSMKEMNGWHAADHYRLVRVARAIEAAHGIGASTKESNQ